MNYEPDTQRLQGWQWAVEKVNAASGGKQSVEEYIAARMDDVADSYNAQRLNEAKEQPEIRALVEKLAAVDKGKLGASRRRSTRRRGETERLGAGM